MKKYCKENVLEAAMTRLEYIFDTFPHVYFSFSGGKDSGAMIQLADQVAQKKKKTFDLLILDIEANYDATRTFMEKIKALPSINDSSKSASEIASFGIGCTHFSRSCSSHISRCQKMRFHLLIWMNH